MRSSLFGFIELILLIGLIQFYRTFSEITTKRRKANLGKTRAESFSAYSVLNDPSPAYIIIKYKKKKAGRERSGA